MEKRKLNKKVVSRSEETEENGKTIWQAMFIRIALTIQTEF